MGVIINEFEVVAGDPPQHAAQREQPAAAQANILSPREIAEIIRHRAERMARVEAH